MSRPFDKTVVTLIERASEEQMCYLSMLLKITAVPENHQAIQTAWEKRIKELGLADDLGVINALSQSRKDSHEKIVAQIYSDLERVCMFLAKFSDKHEWILLVAQEIQRIRMNLHQLNQLYY